MSVWDDADEYCPHCDNHFVSPLPCYMWVCVGGAGGRKSRREKRRQRGRVEDGVDGEGMLQTRRRARVLLRGGVCENVLPRPFLLTLLPSPLDFSSASLRNNSPSRSLSLPFSDHRSQNTKRHDRSRRRGRASRQPVRRLFFLCFSCVAFVLRAAIDDASSFSSLTSPPSSLPLPLALGPSIDHSLPAPPRLLLLNPPTTLHHPSSPPTLLPSSFLFLHPLSSAPGHSHRLLPTPLPPFPSLPPLSVSLPTSLRPSATNPSSFSAFDACRTAAP